MRVRISPGLVASFASLGGTHVIVAAVTDTLGAPRSDMPIWDVTPASSGVTVNQGTVTVTTSATQGE